MKTTSKEQIRRRTSYEEFRSADKDFVERLTKMSRTPVKEADIEVAVRTLHLEVLYEAIDRHNGYGSIKASVYAKQSLLCAIEDIKEEANTNG